MKEELKIQYNFSALKPSTEGKEDAKLKYIHIPC